MVNNIQYTFPSSFDKNQSPKGTYPSVISNENLINSESQG